MLRRINFFAKPSGSILGHVPSFLFSGCFVPCFKRSGISSGLMQSLAEKGGSDLEVVKANEKFFLLATMNPGGDYGKKELSPALRNRFTEIWVPSANNIDDLRSIALGR